MGREEEMPSRERPISVFRVFDADDDLTQNTNKTSDAIDLNGRANNGVFSLQVNISSSSTSTSITITYLVSNDGENFVTPATANDIATAVDVSSGKDEIYEFEPEFARWIQIKITENNAGTVVDPVCDLAVQ